MVYRSGRPAKKRVRRRLNPEPGITLKLLKEDEKRNGTDQMLQDAAYAKSQGVKFTPEAAAYVRKRSIRANPALPRGKWISAKIRVTKSGKIQAKIKR